MTDVMKIMPDSITPSGWGRSIEAGLNTRIIGRPILSYDEVTSTNDVIKDLAVRNAPEGTTVLARAQSRGRGRRGRVWASVPGKGIYMSVLLRPSLPGKDAGRLSLLGGVAVVRALEQFNLRELTLKWPNDVLAQGRKIAGVLIEPRIGAGRIEFAVVGIGINVRQTAEDWTDALKQTATSCHMEGVPVDCEPVIRAVLSELDFWYPLLIQDEMGRLMEEWVQRGGKAGIPTLE
jgi:BirA family transcriptional regulator, biotin operon repressor / biotin---[acetyl-CoA-carboxylase] ligase